MVPTQTAHIQHSAQLRVSSSGLNGKARFHATTSVSPTPIVQKAYHKVLIKRRGGGPRRACEACRAGKLRCEPTIQAPVVPPSDTESPLPVHPCKMCITKGKRCEGVGKMGGIGSRDSISISTEFSLPRPYSSSHDTTTDLPFSPHDRNSPHSDIDSSVDLDYASSVNGSSSATGSMTSGHSLLDPRVHCRSNVLQEPTSPFATVVGTDPAHSPHWLDVGDAEEGVSNIPPRVMQPASLQATTRKTLTPPWTRKDTLRPWARISAPAQLQQGVAEPTQGVDAEASIANQDGSANGATQQSDRMTSSSASAPTWEFLNVFAATFNESTCEFI